MLKSIAKLLLASLLSVTLIITNTLAFHKNDNFEKDKKIIESSGNINKKSLQIDYCTVEVEGGTKKVETKDIDKEKDDKKKETLTAEEIEKIFEEKAKKEEGISSETRNIKDIFTIKHYHSEKFKAAKEYLDFSILKNYELKGSGIKIIGPTVSIQEVLEYYCLQVLPEGDKSKKFKVGKASSLAKLYDQIAEQNGYENKKSSIQGKIYDDAKIYLPIDTYELIYSEAQFIINEEDRLRIEDNQKKADIAAKNEEIRKANELKENTTKSNNQWISEYKQDYIDKFNKKLYEYNDLIKELEKKRNNITQQISIFEEKKSKALDNVENAIDDLNNKTNQDIKDLRTEIRKNKNEYLSSNDLEQYQNDLKLISKMNFKKYERYLTLENLIKRASRSKKAANFVGTDGITILGIQLSQDKIGFIQEFNNIKDKGLASGSDEDEKEIDKLTNTVEKHIKDIDEFILDLVEKLITLDNNLTANSKEKNKYITYLTYLIIFLVVAGVIAYIVIQQNNMKRIRRESEEKVGSLKSDFENKLKDTSEQIKSVSRTAAAAISQQIDTSTAPVPVEEIPKTVEEIIAEKYNELLSDYKEALDDFTKVAVFKQKWHGLPLNRKERQDGSKTILVSSTRAFEKAGIWCVTVGDKYYAFPGSTVKSNMATYMNMDFMKAGQDFKGVFAISTGSTYLTEPAMLRRGGVGFVVEGAGKIAFPD